MNNIVDRTRQLFSSRGGRYHSNSGFRDFEVAHLLKLGSPVAFSCCDFGAGVHGALLANNNVMHFVSQQVGVHRRFWQVGQPKP